MACPFCWRLSSEDYNAWENILIGNSAASIHPTGDYALFYNKRSPTPDEKILSIGDGKKMEVKVFDCVGVVMHCVQDVAMPLRMVAFVPGVPFDL